MFSKLTLLMLHESLLASAAYPAESQSAVIPPKKAAKNSAITTKSFARLDT